MGLFRSIHDLHQQAKELDKDFHPGQMMADGQARMAEATALLAEQTRAAGLAAHGLDATAIVVAVRQLPVQINLQPAVEIDLTVMASGAPPYPVTVRQVAEHVLLPRLQPGARVAVRIAADDRGAVWIDPAGAVG